MPHDGRCQGAAGDRALAGLRLVVAAFPRPKDSTGFGASDHNNSSAGGSPGTTSPINAQPKNASPSGSSGVGCTPVSRRRVAHAGTGTLMLFGPMRLRFVPGI